MTYTVNTSSTTKTVSILRRNTDLTEPKVFYAPGIYERIQYIVNKCTEEVGWLGLVEKIDNDYLITKLYIPEQLVHGAETDISTAAMSALVMEILNTEGDEAISKLRYWGHSHVNMTVSPSSTDEKQVAEYLENCDYFIRGIYNKRDDSKVDVYDKNRGLAFQCVTASSCYLNKSVTDELDALLLANVKRAQAVTQAQNVYNTNFDKKNTTGTTGRTQNTLYAIGKGAREFVDNLKKLEANTAP